MKKEMRALKRIGTGLLALCLLLALAVSALASSGATGAGGESTIEIVTYEKQLTLTIQVVDKASGAGLSQVRVELRDPDHPSAPPITGSPLGIHKTDANGKIEIKLFPDAGKKYQIWVKQVGYDLYVGDIFTIQDNINKQVELVKPVPPGSGGGGGGDNGHWVYYHAGAGGGLDGVELEWVAYNKSPQNVPAPVPDDGYVLSGWMLDGKYVEPGELKVRKAIHIYAVFELQPALSPNPSPVPTLPQVSPSPVGPSPAIPPPASHQPVESPEAPEHSKPRPSRRPQPSRYPRPVAPGLIEPGGSGGTPGGDGQGGTPGGGGQGGPSGGPDDTGVSPAPETNEPAQKPTSPVSGPETFDPSATGQVPQTDRPLHLHRWVVLCTVLTAALAILRLWAIHRRLKELMRLEAERELISK